MRYNLKTVAKLVIALIVLAVAGFGLYWAGIGLWALLGYIWAGICWLFGGLWAILCWCFDKWLWFLGAAAIALIAWLLSKVNWKMPERKPSDNKERDWKWLWAIFAVLLLLLLGLLLFKACGSSSNDEQSSELVAPTISSEAYNIAFDKVVTTRAYLDGVQNGETKTERALVGLKFVNGESVTKMTFAGKTYEEAKAIIAKDWESVIRNNVHANLSEDQLVVVTLFAMRNGKYGFEKSDFLKSVNAGKFDVNTMAIHKADGSKRELRDEAKQYLWVLKNLGNGNLSCDELLDYPSFSYKAISVSRMYGEDGALIFNDSLKARLQRGNYPTPRKALEL
jgi:GH24 family phage-related lysozyme (muramidase)